MFRTDLRLRPDASVMPVCLSMAAAEAYYEAEGRTWERAAYIKARPCGGDLSAGDRFLKTLTPFVWRKHLDFAAIQDAHDMRLRIRALATYVDKLVFDTGVTRVETAGDVGDSVQRATPKWRGTLSATAACGPARASWPRRNTCTVSGSSARRPSRARTAGRSAATMENITASVATRPASSGPAGRCESPPTAPTARVYPPTPTVPASPSPVTEQAI